MTDPKPPVGQQAEHHIEVFSNRYGTTKAVVCSCGFATTYSVNDYDPDVRGREFFDQHHAKFSKPVASPVTLSGETPIKPAAPQNEPEPK